MLRYTFLLAAVMISAISAFTAEEKNSIIYEKYLPDGRIVRVMRHTSFLRSDVAKEYQTDRYSMTVTGGKAALWGRELIIRKADSQNPGSVIRIHDVQVKGDLTAILFTRGEIFAEVTGPGSDGTGKTLFSRSLPGKPPSSAPHIRQGQMAWPEDALYIVAATGDDTVFWVLKNAVAKTEIFSRISGPFSSSEIIKEPGRFLVYPGTGN